MPSGYEKSPDYGGPEYGRRDWIVTLVLFVALMSAPVACSLLTRDATSERAGGADAAQAAPSE